MSEDQNIVVAVQGKVRGIIPAEKLSIDEQVVPFKGKSVHGTYNPKKPKTQEVVLQDICVVWCGWSRPQSGNIHREDRALPRTTRHQGVWQHRVASAVIDSSNLVAQDILRQLVHQRGSPDDV